DGIRDLTVTGVQTCALPIYFYTASLPRFRPVLQDCTAQRPLRSRRQVIHRELQVLTDRVPREQRAVSERALRAPVRYRAQGTERSEERRVGKEWRSRRGGEL